LRPIILAILSLIYSMVLPIIIPVIDGSEWAAFPDLSDRSQ
jgi:hypothetical protein